MASQRFALQRALAELPQFPVTEKTAEQLQSSIEAINRRNTNDVEVMGVGPNLVTDRGLVRMELNAAEAGIDPLNAYVIKRLDREGIGQMGRTGLENIIAPAKNVREISFNMVNEGGVPIFGYEPISDKAVRQQIQGFGGYTKPMTEALYQLLGNVGMKPGDLVKAAPVGMSDGDARRALTYMAQGFGAPDRASGEMYARLGKGGRLEPVQLFSPHTNIADMIRAKQDLTRLAGADGRLKDATDEEVKRAVAYSQEYESMLSPEMPF